MPEEMTRFQTPCGWSRLQFYDVFGYWYAGEQLKRPQLYFSRIDHCYEAAEVIVRRSHYWDREYDREIHAGGYHPQRDERWKCPADIAKSVVVEGMTREGIAQISATLLNVNWTYLFFERMLDIF
jgi:hypothetical protein